MKRLMRLFGSPVAAAFVVVALLAAVPVMAASAQETSGSTRRAVATDGTASTTTAKAENSGDDVTQYTHSASVRAIARFLHLSVDTTANAFEDINSVVLLTVIFGFLFRVVPKILRRRSESLQKNLTDARAATEDANRRLTQVETRLSRLDSEIDAIRKQVEAEAAEDERRIQVSVEIERARIVASAQQEIAASQAAAERELRKFAADLAIDQAMRELQLTSDADRALVREFGSGLARSGGEA